MDYELCKKLKDTGFPQEGKGLWLPGYRKESDKYIVEALYEPTLSELIEACGDKFLQISKNPNETDRKWCAFSMGTDEEKEINSGCGSTPEEAVALLRLKLNREKICPICNGTGEVTTMEPVYPGEPHMAPIGTEPCECQLKDEDE